jgi:hypothetical protein
LNDITPEKIASELNFYEDKLCTAAIYKGTPEGSTHELEARTLKASLYRLGLLDDEENSKRVHHAELRAERVRRAR